ncbi:50S ribosomal protein L17 [Candidatus Curtissbacteria bacterium]|nr:50S ribosomal protein L17 [Candidatus Curtissbacteria bacterium]
MRHQVFGKKLGRDTNARKSLASNLASSLLVEGRVTTTLAKAKFVKIFAEKLIADSRSASLNRRRSLASRLSHQAFLKLITEIGPGFENRAGGYTRIVKLGPRGGDAAPMAKIEILEWDKTKAIQLTKNPKPTKAKKAATTENTGKRTKIKAVSSAVTRKVNEKPKTK